MAEHKAEYAAEIARIIRSLCTPSSILDAGVGEATTLSGVVKHLALDNIKSYGFDISWSRVAYAQNWLTQNQINNATLCTGSLFHIPCR